MNSCLVDSGYTTRRSLIASKPCYLFLTSLLLCAPVANVSANNIAVNTNVPDIAIGDGKCSLIEAINEAQMPGYSIGDCLVGSDGPDTITLEASGPYGLTSVNNETDGPNGLPSITTEITINGNNEIIERSGPTYEVLRIFHVAPTGDLRLNDLTVQRGVSYDDNSSDYYFGAGIYNKGALTLSNCQLLNNYLSGIYNAATGSVQVRDTIFRFNIDAIVNAGVVDMTRTTVNSNDGDTCGALRNTGDMTIRDSAIYLNGQLVCVPGIFSSGETSRLVVVNTTVTNNTNSPGMDPGGIAVADSGFAEIINSTIADNNITDDDYEVPVQIAQFNSAGPPVILRNTIVYSSKPGRNCYGNIISMGHNVSNDYSCNLTAPGDQPNTDPLLGDLADNGGPTLTRALLPGSPAIDAGETNCTDAEGAPLLADQRGMLRPADGNDDGFAACDVGAYEVQPAVPAAPIIGTATPGNARAIVAFTPGDLGTGRLVYYTAKCGTKTATGTASPIGVTGLTNGTTYTCKVKTTSSVGVSPWSASSNSVTPSASVPAAPIIGTATPGNKSAIVAFTPGALGSGTLVKYTAKCGTITATGISSPITVTGLTNGTTYTCKVKTTSSVGDSLWSALSNSVTPSAAGTLPAAPTIGTATPGNARAIVSFTPGALGSGTLINYTAKCGTRTATSISSPITVTGLTNGTTYTCKVKTTSSVGVGPWSASSNSVTPSAAGTLPAAPTIGTATPGNKSASVAFTPGALGSGTLVNHKAKCGSFTATGTSSPITVTGLTNGTTYTCQVKTISSVGVGPWSAMSNSVTPSAAAP